MRDGFWLMVIFFLLMMRCTNSEEDKIPPLLADINSPAQIRARISALDTEVKKHARNDLAYYKMARLYASLNDVENTYKSIKKAMEINPTEIKYKLILTKCFYQKGLYIDAVELLESLSDKIPEKEYVDLAIDIYIQTNKYRQALDLINEQLTHKPTNAYLISQKADITIALGDTSNAIKIYERAIAIDSTLAKPLGALSTYYLHKKDFAKAKEYATQALKLDSTNSQSNYNQALSLKNLGLKDSAIYYYERAIRYDSTFTQAIYNASIIYLQQKKYDKAEQYLKKVILLKSDIPNLEFKLAVTLQNRQKFDEALYYFEKIDTSNINYNFAQKAIKSIAYPRTKTAVVKQDSIN